MINKKLMKLAEEQNARIEKKDEQIKQVEIVKQYRGKTIQTEWGPSLVVGAMLNHESELLVHLKEFGEEDYHITIKDFLDEIK